MAKQHTEESRLRTVVEIMVLCYRHFGQADEVARSKILADLGSMFDGSFRREPVLHEMDVNGRPEQLVTTAGMFLLVANEHGLNLFAAPVQARWSCIVRNELDRLLGPTPGA